MDKCQFCGRPATVHMTQIVNNKTTVIRMCSECAAKQGLFDKSGFPFALLSSLGEALFAGTRNAAMASGLICSKCGCTPMSFKETGRLGCPNCYKDLKLLVDGIVESSQKGVHHKGKHPKSHTIVEVEKARTLGGNDAPLAINQATNQDSKKKPFSGSKRLDELQRMLNVAIKAEQYEEAAKLRDEIRNLKNS
ncbi:MAG: UvrB/UvrC motif-containing protein [Puniceicoccales bacterium]|nr:UvrB/UvrC motif-containing protein [Puniceicoccales bacterium]